MGTSFDDVTTQLSFKFYTVFLAKWQLAVLWLGIVHYDQLHICN